MNDIEIGALPRWTQQQLLGIDSSELRGSQGKISPKRPLEETAGFADVFPYYAGFSYDWARSCIKSCPIAEDAIILDPWNGSGTTTLAAQHAGFRAIGIDRSPIANRVAHLKSNALHGGFRIIEAKQVHTVPTGGGDPLAAWFHEPTVARLRSWGNYLKPLPAAESDLGYVALFRAVRELTTYFEGTNPTWVRRANSDDERIYVEPSVVDEIVAREQRIISERISSGPPGEDSFPAQIVTSSSTALPIRNNSVDFILTSPPYLTRIDYAVAYTRELAILGIDVARDRSLRSALMGTTLIRDHGTLAELKLGPTAAAIVKSVSEHSSKASSGYYNKQTRQYMSDLTAGLDEVSRVAKSQAFLYLVVQDSFYKDVHVRLADVCIEECLLRGWDLVKPVTPYPVKRTLTSLNTQARKYKKSEVVETVITLQKR